MSKKPASIQRFPVVDQALGRVKKTEDLESLRDRLLAAANEG